MDDVEGKLRHLLSAFEGKFDEESAEKTTKDRVYDPNATFSNSKETQEDIDSIIASMQNNK